jgi:hypothetical protein
MSINEVYREFLFRGNKLGTNSMQSVGLPQFVALINKAQLHWAEQRIKAKEINQAVTDEVNPLLKEVEPNLSYKDSRYTFPVPSDYFHWQRFQATTKDCGTPVYGRFVEEGNLSRFFMDEFTKPSSAWEEVLCTLHGNRFRVYVDGFSIERPKFHYYRTPVRVDIEGYTTESGPSSNIDLEFEHVHAHEIIDFAVSIMAGDVNDVPRLQTMQAFMQTNN